MRSQGLGIPPWDRTTSPAQALSQLVVSQSQELWAGFLAMRPRAPLLTEPDYQHARQVDRTIVWTWLMRGTLHLAAAADFPWMIRLLGPGLAASLGTRLRQLGWDDELLSKGRRVLVRVLRDDTFLTRKEIARVFEEQALPFQGQALPNFLTASALEGLICRAADRGKQYTYALVDEWLPPPPPFDREQSLARLALSFLKAYGPAVWQDLKIWAGMKAADARLAFDLVRSQIEPVQMPLVDGKEPELAWMPSDRLHWLDEIPAGQVVVRLQPYFETYLLGYRDRRLLIHPEHHKQVFNGGEINPVLLVDGFACGRWKIDRKSDPLQIIVQPFEPLDPQVQAQVDLETQDIGRFYGMPAVCTILPLLTPGPVVQ